MRNSGCTPDIFHSLKKCFEPAVVSVVTSIGTGRILAICPVLMASVAFHIIFLLEVVSSQQSMNCMMDYAQLPKLQSLSGFPRRTYEVQKSHFSAKWT